MSEWANRSFFWANCSFALSLTKNEQFALQKLWVFCVKMSDSLIPSFWMSDVSKSLRLLTKKMSDHEWFAQVAYQKWANEHKASFLSKSLIFHFFPKNEQFTQKTDERIANSELKMPVICRIEFDLNWFKIYFFFARNINANKPCKCVSKTWQKIT